MQDVTNVLYECLGRVTHIQNELQRQSSAGLMQTGVQSRPQPTASSKTAAPTVDEMMAKLEKISTLSEIG